MWEEMSSGITRSVCILFYRSMKMIHEDVSAIKTVAVKFLLK